MNCIHCGCADLTANKAGILICDDCFAEQPAAKNWWEQEDSEQTPNPAPKATTKEYQMSKKPQKEAAPTTQTIKKPTALQTVIADTKAKAKAPKAAKPAAKVVTKPIAKAAKPTKAVKPAVPGVNPDLLTLLKAIRACTSKSKSPVGNMVPRSGVAHGFKFQKSGGIYSLGKNRGLLEVAEIKPEDGSGKVSSTALTQAGLDLINTAKPAKVAASNEMGLE